MGLVFKKEHGEPLSVLFRHISTGDEVPAGLNEVHHWRDVFDVNKDSILRKEINGSWREHHTVSRILQFKVWMFLTYSRNFVQGRTMEITYDEEVKQFHVTDISPLVVDHSGRKKGRKESKKEMLFEEPKGPVPLVGPDCDKTAAAYLAAAGGEWKTDSKFVSIVFVIL